MHTIRYTNREIPTHRRINAKQITPATKTDDPVFQQFGEPFLVNDSNKVVVNDRAVAVKCATKYQVKFDAGSKSYERYDAERGLWTAVDEVKVARLLDDLLMELGAAHDQQEVVSRISAAKLGSLCRMLRPHDLQIESVNTAGLVHVRNGVVDLGANRPKLLPHEPKYPFRASSEILFNPKAGCPVFLKKFLATALAPADIRLVQIYCGSMLLGPNTCHGILIIRGTPGGGKSTLLTVIEKVIGENNVAYLRTSHLGGRFETSAFLGKRLLVGKDVPGDTLAVSGARMLKSLVGGDLMQAEIKYNPDKKAVRGDYHVVIVSNNNLQIALDGDQGAWGRRLLVVDFKNPKPARPIPGFADELVAKEASGILNWLIEGAMAYRAEMKKYGHLPLTDEQQGRVETLLADSDNVAQFVTKCLASKSGQDVTSEELLLGYHRVCRDQHWTPVPSHKFQTRVPDLLAEVFNIARRNDIRREGRAVRGFKNVALV